MANVHGHVRAPQHSSNVWLDRTNSIGKVNGGQGKSTVAAAGPRDIWSAHDDGHLYAGRTDTNGGHGVLTRKATRDFLLEGYRAYRTLRRRDDMAKPTFHP